MPMENLNALYYAVYRALCAYEDFTKPENQTPFDPDKTAPYLVEHLVYQGVAKANQGASNLSDIIIQEIKNWHELPDNAKPTLPAWLGAKLAVAGYTAPKTVKQNQTGQFQDFNDIATVWKYLSLKPNIHEITCDILPGCPVNLRMGHNGQIYAADGNLINCDFSVYDWKSIVHSLKLQPAGRPGMFANRFEEIQFHVIMNS